LRRASILLLGAVTALLVVPAGHSAPSSVASKQAQVDRVLVQIRGLDSSLERAVEAYNSANARLAQIRSALRTNSRRLALARTNLRRSQAMLAERLVAIYTSEQDDSTLSVLLGASSFSDFIDRVDTVDRVSDQDARVHRQVVAFRTEVARRQAHLKHARSQQQHVVAQRAAEKASIEGQLAQRRQLVSSIRSEIQRMKEEEARRQAELARQARARALAQAAAPAPVLAAPVGPSTATPSPAQPAAPASPAAPTAALPPGRGSVVSIAMRYLGTPYRWGGASPSTGFDCSGFVMYVFSQVGVSLPHSSYSQYGMGMPVARSQLQPGDLVFFDGLGHVGIYIGGNQFIHSPHTGDVVKISAMTGWYASTYVGARRI
jgi:cell wall-associated NlpC family hydrolase